MYRAVCGLSYVSYMYVLVVVVEPSLFKEGHKKTLGGYVRCRENWRERGWYELES